jgi:hypothetical protein
VPPASRSRTERHGRLGAVGIPGEHAIAAASFEHRQSQQDSIDPRPSTMRQKLLILSAFFTAACAADQEPMLRVGLVELAPATLQALQPPEQQMLLDLLGFGQAVARDELPAVGAPFIEREVTRSRLENLPLFLGARFAAVDETTLREAYASNPEWELVVRHVVRLADRSAPAALRDSARMIAAEVAARAAAGDDFAALAAQYSEEPGAAARGGLLQPGRRGSWVDEFWAAALALRPGETTGVVETPYGFHVLKLEDRKPVPFEEADRVEMLRWFVPASMAESAMADWVATDGGISLDAPAVAAAFDAFRAGEAVREDAVLATSATGTHYYTGADLAAGWQLLTLEERMLLERATPEAFADWVENDARNVLWGKQAEHLGATPRATAAAEASRYWDELAAAFARVFGFMPGMSDEQLVAAAVRATLSGTPDARSARAELRALRPRLRQLYPLTESTPAT